MRKITKIITAYIDENTHYLLRALMEKKVLTISQSLREMIDCALIDYYEEDKPFYDFAHDLRGVHKVPLPFKVACGVDRETYDKLKTMADEIGVRSVSTLLRKIIQHIIIGYWIDCFSNEIDNVDGDDEVI